MRGSDILLDWINCMLEFAAFQGIFFSISGTSGCPLKTYILYYVLGALASIYFVSAGPDILVLNITLYVAILLFSFGKPSVKRAIRPALCSVPFMLITEFILLSLLPLSSMQTDTGPATRCPLPEGPWMRWEHEGRRHSFRYRSRGLRKGPPGN